MMKQFKLAALFMMAVALVFFAACTSDEDNRIEPPTAQEIIERTWTLETLEVTENGLDVSDLSTYDNFSLVIGEGTYAVQNGGDAFPNSTGTWRFASDDVQKDIILDEGSDEEVFVEVTSLQSDDFRFTFTREGRIIGGRVEVIPTRTFTFRLRGL